MRHPDILFEVAHWVVSPVLCSMAYDEEKAKHQRKWISRQAGKQAASKDREEESGKCGCL